MRPAKRDEVIFAPTPIYARHPEVLRRAAAEPRRARGSPLARLLRVLGRSSFEAPPARGRGRASEAVNLSISAIFDMSQIKDLAPPEFAKIEKIRSLSG